MNRKTLFMAILALMAIAIADSPGSLNAQQSSQDRKSIQADGTTSATDAKEVKRLNDLAAQAINHTRQLHQVYLQNVGAREAAVKSHGEKDSRTQQAYKEEATAKQDWTAGIKNEQDVAAQRKAAIEKLHADSSKRTKDVDKLDSDGQKRTSSAPKN
jgi:hypothetical protein